MLDTSQLQTADFRYFEANNRPLPLLKSAIVNVSRRSGSSAAHTFLTSSGERLTGTPQNQEFIVCQPRICCQDWAGVLGPLCPVF